MELGEAQTPRSLRMSQQKTSKISFDKTFFSLLNLSLSLLGGVAPILAIFDQNFDRFGQFLLTTSCSKKIKTKLFKLRKVNHTLGDHRSGRAWDSNHGPNETDGRHLSQKPKNLRKKLPKKKNEKFSEKKIKQKKIKETFSLVPLSLPSLNCKGNFFSPRTKMIH